MKYENHGYVLFFVCCVLCAILLAVNAETASAYQRFKPMPQKSNIEAEDEIVTGYCTFGDCYVARPRKNLVISEETTRIDTESLTIVYTTEEVEESVIATSIETESVIEFFTETEPQSFESVTDTHDDGYIGTMFITGYTAEEGFPEGSETASGYGVRPWYCAMNDGQRQSLGISYGDQIYVDGLGTYTVMDCGCDWGCVDIWLYTNAEAYEITGFRDVYLY